MSRYFQDLLTAAKTVKKPSPELREAIEAVEEHLSEPRRQNILELGRATLAREGELEFDDDAIASEGDDNGTYLQAWVWVDFSGTNLDKNQSPNSVQETEPNQQA
jgi:hypothetical protein